MNLEKIMAAEPDVKKPGTVETSSEGSISSTTVGAISEKAGRVSEILTISCLVAFALMLFILHGPASWTQPVKDFFSQSEPVDKYTVLLNAEFNRSQEYVKENGTYNGFVFTDEISGVTSRNTIIMSVSAPGKCVFAAYSRGQEFLIGEDTKNEMCSPEQLTGFQNLLNKKDFENTVKV